MPDSQVQVLNPEGQLGSIPASQLQDATEQGYREATPQVLNQLKHGNSEAATFVEGAVQGVGGPAGTALMTSMGIPEEDLLGRAEANPIAHGAGEALGLLSPVGEGALIAKAGKVVGTGIKGVAGGSKIARLVAAAGTGATEASLFAAGDEASKALLHDPNQTAETALANVGMAGLLGAGGGAALGSIPAAWDTLMEGKAGQYLTDFKQRLADHANGLATADGLAAASSKKIADALENYKSEFKFPQDSKIESQLDALIDRVKTTAPDALSDADRTAISKRLGDVIFNAPDVTSLSPGAKLADALLSDGFAKSVGASVGGTVGAVLHHPFIGAIFGERAVAPIVKKIIPALTGALMSQPVSGAGAKSAISLSLAALKGETTLNKAALGVFGTVKDAFPAEDAAKNARLSAQVQDYKENPNMLFQHGRQVGAYLPEHETALAEASGRVMQYLAQLQPNVQPAQPMDPARKPSWVESANFDNAVKIANNPLSILAKVKSGELTKHDLSYLQTMYPTLYGRMQSKLIDQLIQHTANEQTVPYKTKLALSRFLDRPLDSSMTSAYMQTNLISVQGLNQPAQAGHKQKSTQTGLAKLSKLPELERTQAQQAQSPV